MAERQVDPNLFDTQYFRVARKVIIADLTREVGAYGVRPAVALIHAWAEQTGENLYSVFHIARHYRGNSVEAWVEDVDIRFSACEGEADMLLREHAERKLARLCAMYAGGRWGG